MSVANRLLVAGAGTGKTYQLVEQVRALLRAKIPASKIAAITFTEAATGELQERIRRDIPEFPQASDAQVTTIHGFCASLLRERPIEAGVTPQFTMLDGLGRTLLLEELWSAWIEEKLDHDGPIAQGRIAGVTRETMKKTALALLEHRDRLDRLAPGDHVRALAEFAGAYAQAKRQRGALDFDDLLLKTRDLLRHREDVRETMRGRFAHILVDEFQDTDPMQAEILWLLSTNAKPCATWWEIPPEPGRLFAVGDPQQSIYGFRRADLAMFERAAQSLEMVSPRGREPLLVSRRSIPRIVSWVNATFGTKLESMRKDADAPEGGVFVLLPAEKLEGKKKGVREAEARAIAGFLGERIERGLAPGDCAILMRSLNDAGIYEDALIAAGIPVATEGGKSYFGRREVKFLAAWLRALDNPLDRVAVVAALRSPLFGVSDRDLAGHAGAGGSWDYRVSVPPASPTALAPAMSRLAADRAQRGQMSVAAFLERSFEETGVLGLLRLQPGGEQRVANFLHALRTARELESRGPLSFSDFVEYFSRNESELREESLPSVIEGREAVRILTMHRSKGLEFPLVVLPDLTRNPPPNKETLLHDRASDRLEYRVAKESIESEGFEKALLGKKAAELEESRRLLYVAATRARDTLVIPRFFAEKPRKESLFSLLPAAISRVDRDPLDGEHDGATFVTIREKNTRPLSRGKNVSKSAAEQVSLQEASRKRQEFLRARELLCAKAAVTSARILPSSLTHESKPDSSSVGKHGDGPAVGTAVHGALARGDWDCPESFGEALELEMSLAGLDRAGQSHARECLQNALALPIFERARKAKRRFRELPFVFTREGREMVGQIDLAFEEENGWIVVDYKTDRVGADALDSVASRYRPQIEAYAQALEVILGLKVVERTLAFLSVGKEIVIS